MAAGITSTWYCNPMPKAKTKSPDKPVEPKRPRGRPPGPAKPKSDAPAEFNVPKKLGRPSSYTEEVASVILDRLANGESLLKICADPDLPCRQTVIKWATENEAFFDKYTRARACGVDVIAETAVAEATADVPYEQVAAARLAFDARRWFVSKLAPQRWGEKIMAEVDARAVVASMDLTPTNEPTDAARVKALTALFSKVKAKSEAS